MRSSELDESRRREAMQRSELVEAVGALGALASSLEWTEQPAEVRAGLRRVLLDDLVVLAAGALLPETTALLSWPLWGEGPCWVLGSTRRWSATDAAFVSGVSMVSLELDEGNKMARGHASAHVLPVVLALGQALGADGHSVTNAFLVGHEIASRFGRATRLHPGVHPHGTWGACGAAAAAGRLLGLPAAQIAHAIDLAGSCALATSFEAAYQGLPVRNAWAGAASVMGLQCALLAATGDGEPAGIAADTLGRLLGELEVRALTEELGRRFDVSNGYFKRHASCSYTHPPADAVLEIVSNLGPKGGGGRGFDRRAIAEDAERVVVETHQLAAELSRAKCPTRLAAMFSIPYVVAAAFCYGDCRPERFEGSARSDPVVNGLVQRVEVRHAEEFDAMLPAHRGCRVTVHWRRGGVATTTVTDPVWDVDHDPPTEEDLREKAARLLPGTAESVVLTAEALPECTDLGELFGNLAKNLAASRDAAIPASPKGEGQQ